MKELENELRVVRSQCQRYQSTLDSAWGRVARLVSSEGVCGAEGAKELLDWLEEVKTMKGLLCF